MADKPEGGGGLDDLDVASRLGMILIGLAVLSSVAVWVNKVATSAGEFSVSSFLLTLAERFGLIDFFYAVRIPFIIVSILVSCVFAAGIVYANKKRAEIRKNLTDEMRLLEQKLFGGSLSDKNPRWEHVLAMASSESPGDWRVAIIEADSMLEELLTSMSYHGLTLGDKLKSIEPSDFRTLDLAWEAHKVRNRIAHSGSNFILTQRETKRVVELYRQVFEEFDYV